MEGRKMRENTKKSYPWLFWSCAIIIWVIISALLVNRFIDPTIESILRAIFKNETIVTETWAEVFETLIMTLVGLGATVYFDKLTTKNLRKVNEELLEKLAKDSSDNAYSAYYTIIHHTQDTQGMKKLVNNLVKLPRYPEIMKALIEDYSSKATDSKFLVDFPTFLKLGEILTENSNEIMFVNTTPPYEWKFPIRFEKNDEIKDAIKNYKKKVEEKLESSEIIKRITIVENLDSLTSILEDGIDTYFRNLGIIITSKNLDDNIARPLVGWIQEILVTFKKNLLSSYTSKNNNSVDDILKIVNDILNIVDDHVLCPRDKWNKFFNKYCDTSESKFKQPFHELSKVISLFIIEDFIKLHKPENNGWYIVKNEVIDNKKDDLRKFAKEEGIYVDSQNNNYLLRIEENGTNNLLVTVKIIDDLNDTNFQNLLDKFINTSTDQEWERVGTLMNLPKLEGLK
jgi:hypothetical protein